MNSNSVKLLKVLFEVGFCNFALQYIAYLLLRVFNSDMPCVMFFTVFSLADLT